MRIAAILVAAGSGSRFGAETPKQFLPLAGKPVIRHRRRGSGRPRRSAAAGRRRRGDRGGADGLPHLPPVPGGATRQDSVRAGLEALEALGTGCRAGTRCGAAVDPGRDHPCPAGGPGARCRGDPRRAGRRYAEACGRRPDHRHGAARRPVPCPDAAGVPLPGAARRASQRRRAAPPTMRRCWRRSASGWPSSPAPRTTSS